MSTWSDFAPERRAYLLRTLRAEQLVERYGGSADAYETERKRTWDAMTNDEQYVMLRQNDPHELAGKYGKTLRFFERAQAYAKTIEAKGSVTNNPHTPPKKKLIQEARRDLTLGDALCELIDNSIDRCVLLGHEEVSLNIRIHLDYELRKGFYYDNAGGMAKDSVFRVFIPGETSSAPTRAKIGSFGFGAKKAIFFLSDGTSVFSALSRSSTHFAAIPEGWAESEGWNIEEGEVVAPPPLIGESRKLDGETLITFERLRQTADSGLDETSVHEQLGRTYSELLLGRRDTFSLGITFNDRKVEANDPVVFAGPRGSGAPPRRYYVRQIFENLEGTDGGITEMEFELLFGLLPGQKAEYGRGVDVYGNYRLFAQGLRQSVGLGRRKNMRLTDLKGSAANLLRGKLFITGPSEGVPWDTNKRHFLTDHPVARFVKDAFEDVYREYVQTVDIITRREQGTKMYLVGTETSFSDIEVVDAGRLVEGVPLPTWPTDKLPKWEPPPGEEVGSGGDAGGGDGYDEGEDPQGDEESDEDEEFDEDEGSEFVVSSGSLPLAIVEALSERYGEDISFCEQMQKALEDAAGLGNLIIRLGPGQVEELKSRLGCSTIVELEEAVRQKLVSRLGVE